MNYNDDQNDLKKSGKREFVIDKAALGKGALPHPELNNSGSQKAVIPILAGGGLSMLALSVVLVAFFFVQKESRHAEVVNDAPPPAASTLDAELPTVPRAMQFEQTSDKNLSAAQLVSKGSQVYAQNPANQMLAEKYFKTPSKKTHIMLRPMTDWPAFTGISTRPQTRTAVNRLL